jgi:antitoxin MazE
MQAVIKKWGNSPALRLSAAIMKSAHLSLDQLVSVKVQRGRIVIEPIVKNEYSLEELISRISDDNIHREMSFGRTIGEEML